MSTYEPSPSALRELIDRRLGRVLDERASNLPDAAPLIDEIRRVIASGGKRLRPSFCFWGYGAATGGRGDEVLDAAAALELLHTFAIVHDDIMDRAPERRGVATVNAARGDDVALLVGDLALVLADDLFMHSGFSSQAISRGFGCYSRMRQEVIAGQYLDLEAARSPEMTEAQARRIAVLKSGRYTVEEPLAIGATLGGAADDLLERLSAFAAPLGEAFQLRDDLLGTFGRSAETGKSVDSDIRQGKRNILFAMTLARLSGDDRTFFSQRWGAGSELGEDDVERLRALIDSSGARAATEKLLVELGDKVEEALARLEVDRESGAALRDLARLAIERDS
jgi:geranylgeranyl diphosphate synthase type I